MGLRLSVLLIAVASLLGHSVSAQENMRFRRHTIEDGLSQSTVESIVQDQDGFLWIGTEDGLNRYDGYSFKIYKHDLDDPGSLADNNIWCLHVDRSGNLWVGTYSNGLDRYDPRTEIFTHYVHDPDDPHSLSSNRVRSISEDENGNLWIGSRDGLSRFDMVSQQFTVWKHDPQDENSLPSDNIRYVYPESGDVVWIASSRGFSRLDVASGRFTHNRAGPAGSNSIRSDNVRHIMADRAGMFWISTGGGLVRYDPRSGRITNHVHDETNPASISSDNVRKAFEDSRGRLWIATTYGGLGYLDRQSGLFRAFLHDTADPHSITNSSLRIIFEDEGGILWIGTMGGGMCSYDPRTDRFRHYEHDPDDSNSLGHALVWSVAEGPEEELWFGTTESLDRLDKATGRVERFSYNRFSPRGQARNDFTRSLTWDRSGLLWIGSAYTGVAVFDPQAGEFTFLRHDEDEPGSLSTNSIRTVYQDRQGHMWVGTTSHGLNLYLPETRTFRHFIHDPDDPGSISGTTIVSLLQDSDGIYWVATNDGLNRLDFGGGDVRSETPEITSFHHDPDDPGSMSSSYVISVYEASDGDLWFGTMLGLCRLRTSDRDQPVFTRYLMKNGLPSDVVYGILEDDRGRLWLGTNYGLSCFDPGTETFKNYDTRDGLLGNEYNTGAYARTASCTFVFGGVGGASEFHPDEMIDSSYEAPLVLTGFNVFDQPARFEESLNCLGEITLSYRDNYFSFEFASLDFSTPDRNRYAYKLEGQDRDWTQAGTRNFAGFTHVDPGEYTFMVKGTNGDGVWNDEVASIRIVVTPPFWKTWWFILLLALAAGGGIAFLIMVRVRQLLAIERLRSKIAADLHDDIGAGLTEISIMGHVISQKLPAEPRGLVHAETERIGATARGLIASMSDIVWLVDPRRDSLYDLASRLSDSFKETLNALGIEFRTENLESLKSVRLKMEYRQHLLLIFKEAINNSLKYSKCTEISLGVVLKGRKLCVRLVDNGTGFDLQDHRDGNGLENMQERAQLLGGTLTVESSAAKGTAVEYCGSIA